MNVTRNLFCWVLKVTPLSCVEHTVDTSVERLSLPKTFYNSALLSRLFVSLCLGSGFSHLFVVSSEFLFGRCVCHCLVAQSCLTLRSQDCSVPGSSVHGDSPGKNTGVGCHALLQGIFLTQRWNSGPLRLLHCRQILYRWAEIYLMYKKPTLIMKIHNQWKVKMEKPKQAFVFYQLIIRKTLHFIWPSFIYDTLS